MQRRRILELTLGGAALVAVAVAVGISLGSSGGDASSSAEGSAADALTVAGDVAYRERIAWPAGAVVTVRIEDVSRADAPSTVLAEQQIVDATGIPVPFELSVPRAQVPPHARLAIRAQITVDGALRWTTDTFLPVPTDTPVPPQHLLLVGVRQP
ncbi:YbaY family lipoprotein [Rhodococcus kronopolitis]|uniref:YbaY family lipoprotein n=1 Tax=Rhodococcus kronopolitis TaxID=1460226 RepID=A0ABV9FM69_9NOCA